MDTVMDPVIIYMMEVLQIYLKMTHYMIVVILYLGKNVTIFTIKNYYNLKKINLVIFLQLHLMYINLNNITAIILKQDIG